MSKRTIALVALIPLAIANALNAVNVIDLGWVLWPVVFATMAAAIVLITTPSEGDLGNG